MKMRSRSIYVAKVHYKYFPIVILILVQVFGLTAVTRSSIVRAAEPQDIEALPEIKPVQIQETDSLNWSQPIQNPIDGLMVADKDYNPYSVLLSTWSPQAIRVTFRQRNDVIIDYTRDIDFYECDDGQRIPYTQLRAKTQDRVIIPIALWFTINNKAYVYRGGKVAPELAKALANAPDGDIFIRAVWPDKRIYDMRVGRGTVAAWKKIYQEEVSTSTTTTPNDSQTAPAIEPVLLSGSRGTSWSEAVRDSIDGLLVADKDDNAGTAKLSTWSARAIRVTIIEEKKIPDGEILVQQFISCSNGKGREYTDVETRLAPAVIVPKELRFVIYGKAYIYQGGVVPADLAQALKNAPVGDMFLKAIYPDDTEHTMRIGPKTVAAWRLIYQSVEPQPLK
jgi:hypothetical protein